MSNSARAIVVCSGLFLLVMAAYFVALALGPVALVLYFAAPVVSGAGLAYLFHKRAFRPFVALGLANSCVLGALHFVWTALGHPTDFGGQYGSLWVAGLAVLSIFPLTLVGGALGGLVSEP